MDFSPLSRLSLIALGAAGVGFLAARAAPDALNPWPVGRYGMHKIDSSGSFIVLLDTVTGRTWAMNGLGELPLRMQWQRIGEPWMNEVPPTAEARAQPPGSSQRGPAPVQASTPQPAARDPWDAISVPARPQQAPSSGPGRRP